MTGPDWSTTSHRVIIITTKVLLGGFGCLSLCIDGVRVASIPGKNVLFAKKTWQTNIVISTNQSTVRLELDQ